MKTAGTSWLEAVRLIALMSPSLYREMHRCALSHFQAAAQLYHVSTRLDRIPDPEGLKDQDLHRLLDEDDSRQLLHITYGFLLRAEGEAGQIPLRDRMLGLLAQYEEDYWSLLDKHIEKHLITSGVEREKDCESDHPRDHRSNR